MEAIVSSILLQMQQTLDGSQLKRLKTVLEAALAAPNHDRPSAQPPDLLSLFLTAKSVEGCSPKTIAYYENTIAMMRDKVAKPFTQVTSDDLRRYLSAYEADRRTSKTTIDNIRRIFSSFFAWLEDEDYIVKSPVRRIHKVKTAQTVKATITDEEMERIRERCGNARDLAIVDVLASTGMRVGELVRLKRCDVDLHEREFLVTGKGNKQRPVYFDARAKLHLEAYLDARTDESPELFVSLTGKPRPMTVGNVESRIRDIGRKAGVAGVHPHKFRRTLATDAIDKGMPIEQVQRLLGHVRIDTTMHYAMVNQNNVKASHRRYLE